MEPKQQRVLTLPIILELLAPPASLEALSPRSKSPGDIAKVLIRCVSIGKLIKEFDPDEEIFHVEHCIDNELNKEWCEIWRAVDWKESNTRRTAFRQRADLDRTEHNKKSARLKEIQESLINKGLNQKPGFVEHLAESMYSSWKAGRYSEMFQVLKMGEMISRFEEEDKTK